MILFFFRHTFVKDFLPLTRSSMTCANTFTTVMLPMRARAMEAADRMKSPAKMAYKDTTQSK